MFKVTPKIRPVRGSGFVRAFVQVLFHPVGHSAGVRFGEPESCQANNADCSTSQGVLTSKHSQSCTPAAGFQTSPSADSAAKIRAMRAVFLLSPRLRMSRYQAPDLFISGPNRPLPEARP